MRILLVFATALAIFFSATGGTVAAQGAPSIIRDAELESALREISAPIFKAASLNAGSVQTYIVQDNTLNAFVAGGQNVFVNTGLIMATDNVNQLVGVIAHETGHIAGGHLVRFDEGMKGASTTSIISMILGAAAIATGAGDAGMAILLGGQTAAQRSLLAYSRTQEASADQAAMKFLNKSHQSGRGLVSFFETLEQQELLYTTNRDPYIQSHPLTQDRVDALKKQVQDSPYYNAPNPDHFDELYERMKAKLVGYLQPLRVTLQRYPVDDDSLPARYARAYAYHKAHEVDKALAEVNSLLEDRPEDPYFWETKGFILFENGKIRESITPYRNAVKLAPKEPLIRTELAQSLIATEDKSVNEEAIRQLEAANRYDRDNPFAWHQLSIAYHVQGEDGMAHLAAAEYFALIGRTPEARMQAHMATKALDRGTPSWLRAEDLLAVSGPPNGERRGKGGEERKKEPNGRGRRGDRDGGGQSPDGDGNQDQSPDPRQEIPCRN